MHQFTINLIKYSSLFESNFEVFNKTGKNETIESDSIAQWAGQIRRVSSEYNRHVLRNF